MDTLNQSQLSDWVAVGRIGAPYGIKGAFHVQSFTMPASNLLNHKEWFIDYKNEKKIFIPLDLKTHGKDLVARLELFTSPESVRELVNSLIYIPADRLPSLKEGEYYWAQLIGLTVINQDGITLGIVNNLLATGSNDILVVKGERERLLPYLDDYVLEIDINKRIMKVDWDPEF
ncbi:MAG: rimM [Francisellaceae bacterium]|nr:rimM [Francisellaceae bacterium]